MVETNFSVRIGRIRKTVRCEFEMRAAALDITVAQFQVLRRLSQGDNVPTSVIANDIGACGSSTTGVLDRLEARGLLTRKRSQSDRRAVEVSLTPAGRALMPELNAILDDLDEKALAGLTPDELKQFIATLDKVGANLEAN